ncbi:MAG: transcription-repair coupling factor [Oscillospiraceae bacterium]|nr:transcription-repair coupling factor [Oscillospiraceae bacterium]MBQ7129630.1 transcription-repair coupling factor [Oscillospiraceae bacterium]
MEQLLHLLKTIPEYTALLDALKEGKSAAVTGIGQINRSHMIAGLTRDSGSPIVILCQDDMAARRLQEELKGFLGIAAPILPSRDLTLYDAAVVSRSWEQKRLRQLYDLAAGKTRIQILSWESLSQRTMPRPVLLKAAFSLEVGQEYPIDELTRRLSAAGYSRCGMVEGPGQFAVRGGIIDIYSPGEDLPIRAEFFGDELDTMGYFDPATQRRSENTEQVLILPVGETQPSLHPGGMEGLCRDISILISRQKRRKNLNEALITTLTKDLEKYENGLTNPASDRYMAMIYPEMATAADYIPENAVMVLCDHSSLQRSARNRSDEMGMQLDSLLQTGLVAGELCDYVCQWEDFCAGLRGRKVVYFDAFGGASYPEDAPPKILLPMTAKQLPGYGGNLDTAASDLAHYQKVEFGALVLCGTRRRAELLQQMLREKGLSAFLCIPLTSMPKPGQILLTEGTLPFGMEYPLSKLAILTEGQLLSRGEPRKKAAAKKTGATNRQKLNSFTDLTPGDLVVHENYGIGRFVAMEQIKVDNAVKDYIKIAYQGSDTLFVPATQLDLVSKYIGGGGEDTNVRLNKIGSDAWQKTKAKARKAAKDMAGELIQLYAARKRQLGYAFSADAPWQKEFEDNFPYPETDDQLRCIADIKRDMESPQPMDRLLCGDVGFGKTEVALRAVMKAVMDGKQVAILVPTTVLAQQHYQTAVSRFRGFPVNIDVLSRFRSPKLQQQTMHNVAAGSVDLIIGTHKLLQKNMQFKDLGLLIIDEEQRFGVSHKERLKEMSRGVDVLTLSATPIPRTLNMALSGIRDMSTIEEPPSDRYPVQTFVMEHNNAIIDDAIRREVERGGQVYYLHNRTETIDQCAAALKKRIPGLSVGVAHGQMGEDALGDVMQAMTEGDIQVLVCTTIIETGLDIPNANTLIIENADRFGLSQLHQLRGRVGRSTRHAYAYFTYRPDKNLTEVAEKRLSAIRDFAEFGSGFKIAMRDLEIRGAGNLLGAEQSGHMMSVGYDMYLKLLDEAVLEEKGEAPKTPDCTADLNVTANVDKRYVERGEERMDLYRRMAAIRSQEDADDLLDEIVDRYGEPPRGVLNLIDIALLRAQAREAGIKDIRQKAGDVLFTLHNLNFEAVGSLCADPDYKTRVTFLANAKEPTLRLKLSAGVDSLKQSKIFVQHYRSVALK